MKKLFVVILFVSTLFLSACSKADFKSYEEVSVYPYIIKPSNVKVDGDKLKLTFEWKDANATEDSMDKMTFGSTGMLFFAEQDGQNLESINDEDLGYGKYVFPDSFSSVYPSFKLLNEDDDVIVTITRTTTSTDQSEQFTINLK